MKIKLINIIQILLISVCLIFLFESLDALMQADRVSEHISASFGLFVSLGGIFYAFWGMPE